MSRAEALTLALVSALAGGVVAPYVFDGLGLDIAPRLTAGVILAAGIVVATTAAARNGRTADLLVPLAVCGTTTAVLLWLAPDALPPGSGPDLTHHLLLAGYIQDHGTLVHDPNAAAAIGEMAQYTPGLHALSAVAATLLGTDAHFTIYPILVVAVALKFSLVALSVLRLVGDHPGRLALAIATIALLFSVPSYTFGSFVHDSFLAQVASELFAVAMFWALIAWNQQPSWWTIGVFALCGTAAFLTWPIWIGPPVTALVLLCLLRRDLPSGIRIGQTAAAIVPIAVVAVAHLLGRSSGLGLAGTSGAVSLPALSAAGSSLLVVALAGLILSAGTTLTRPLLAIVVALALQAGALWLVARERGATTPYMSLKTTYLAIYPLAMAAVIALARVSRTRSWAVAVAAMSIALAVREVAAMPPAAPTVRRDLWAAGEWARAHTSPACVDYLVANEYTAYWLHLAVLGNARSAARSTDQGTYDTQASFARWLSDAGGAPYAIARASALPAEIRDRFPAVFREGDAVVLSRPADCAER